MLQLELDFIRNYISLEQLRMPHPLRLNFEADEIHVEIPPMLLMPFVENLFKHGIDKTRNDNEATIQLRVDEQNLSTPSVIKCQIVRTPATALD